MIKFRDNLYIGNYKDAEKVAKGEVPEITAVLNVAFEILDDLYNPKAIRFIQVGLMDNNLNPDYIKRLAVHTLEELLDADEVVLVHCAAGLSRSVYTALQAIAEIEGKDTHDLYEELKKIHPMAMYGPLFENSYIPIGAQDGIQ